AWLLWMEVRSAHGGYLLILMVFLSPRGFHGRPGADRVHRRRRRGDTQLLRRSVIDGECALLPGRVGIGLSRYVRSRPTRLPAARCRDARNDGSGAAT